MSRGWTTDLRLSYLTFQLFEISNSTKMSSNLSEIEQQKQDFWEIASTAYYVFMQLSRDLIEGVSIYFWIVNSRNVAKPSSETQFRSSWSRWFDVGVAAVDWKLNVSQRSRKWVIQSKMKIANFFINFFIHKEDEDEILYCHWQYYWMKYCMQPIWYTNNLNLKKLMRLQKKNFNRWNCKSRSINGSRVFGQWNFHHMISHMV